MKNGHDSNQHVKSMALLPESAKQAYLKYYEETYRSGILDMKTKELISISASLAAGCHNCLIGHIKKARQYGATDDEIKETVSLVVGICAAAAVDRADIAHHQMRLSEELEGVLQEKGD